MKSKLLTSILLLLFLTNTAGADPVTAPAAPSSGTTKDLITVNFNQADIQSVFRIMALKGNVNIVAGPEIVGEVTLQLNNVPWEQAFDTIVRTYGYTYEQEGNIYRVMTPEQFSAQRLEGARTEVFTLQYANLAQVADALSEVLGPTVNLQSIPGMNQFVITDTPSNLNNAREVIAKIDQRQLQVLIETKIVTTRLRKEENLGIDWSVIASFNGARRPITFPFSEDPSARRLGKFFQRFDQLPLGQTAAETTTTATTGGATLNSSSTDFPKGHSFPFTTPEDFTFGTIDFTQFGAVLNMLKNRDNTKIVSNPRIVTLNHMAARIQVGEDVGIPTFERNPETGAFEVTGYETRNTGIVLSVTPHITAEKEVVVHVRPEVTGNVVFETITQTNLSVPRLTTIAAETNVLVNSGDTLVIGGLIEEQEGDSRNKVPYLHRIPLFGWIFKHINPSRNRVEHIFFVTITIVDDVYNRQALKEWRQKEAEYEDFRQKTEEEFLEQKKDKNKKKKKFFFF